jgi:hypothetical protein
LKKICGKMLKTAEKRLFMSSIMIAILITFSFHSAFAQLTSRTIGVNEKGIYKLTTDMNSLKKTLEDQLKKEGNPALLYKAAIVKDSIEGAADSQYYILLAQNKIGNIKIAVELELADGVFRASWSKASNAFGTYATCFGACTNGCIPKKAITAQGYKIWKCTNCPERSDACRKSVTTNL